MKKINLLLIFIGVFLGCIVISLTIKRYLNIDGDYLSAAATFFAAIVAFYLYSDWRIQYKVSKLDILYIKFDNTTKSILEKLHEIDYLLISHNLDSDSVNNKLDKLIRNWNFLSRDFRILNDLLTEYKIIIYSLSTRNKILKDHLQDIEDIQNEISPKIINIQRVLTKEENLDDSDKINIMRTKFIKEGYRPTGSKLSIFVFNAKTNVLNEILKGQ